MLFFIFIIIIGIVIVGAMFLFFIKSNTYDLQEVNRSYYTKGYFFPRNEHDIYVFKKICVDTLNRVPDRVYYLELGYVCLWRNFGSGGAAVGLDTYSTIVIVKTGDNSLYGHIRARPTAVQKKPHQILQKKYFYCAVDIETPKEYYVSTYFYDKIKILTKDFKDDYWNFVFYDGYLAVYKQTNRFTMTQVLELYDYLSK